MECLFACSWKDVYKKNNQVTFFFSKFLGQFWVVYEKNGIL